MSFLATLKRSSPSAIALRRSLILRRPLSSAARDDCEGPSISRPAASAAVVTAVCSAGAGLLFLSVNPDGPPIAFADCRAVEPADDRVEVHAIRGVSEKKKKTRFLFGDSYRRKVFFNYEKRIRLRSPPEKVFEYFASFRTPEGEVFMTPTDLMRAVVPVFPPSESDIVREGYLRGERPPGELRCGTSNFFMLFDTNNDGLISFPEYIFFVTLLSIPESSFSAAFKMFDLDHNGEIEREEFKKVMALMRSHNRQGACHRDGIRIGLKVGSSVENAGVVEHFFGKDGNSCLQHDRFVEFLRQFHDEIVRLEFAHYDYKLRGTISAKDFALSMVAAADISHISKFLDRADEIDHDLCLRDIRISFEEFKAFAELRKRLQPLSLAIFSYGKVNGLLTKEDFQRAASHVCGVGLSDNVIDLIFHVFDTDKDGSISYDEFLGALQRRERDIGQPMTTGLAGMVSCWLNCAKNRSPGNLIV
ncbi:hypothetical protein QJS04_geneDACA003746 [Acorus gramineus]|uniref:EF-hand domain-containing protein n=1 Tax=Acorus gramineus TaxID=55184 RepID=A0AAV9BL73_ACOGR|nr:hypothetical protein QJS04_geneDACA003746 [Acorus gramineus]